MPFVPPLTSPTHTKPLFATKAKTGETAFDIKGKVMQWPDVTRHAVHHVPRMPTARAHGDADVTAAAQRDAQPDHRHDVCLGSDAHNLI